MPGESNTRDGTQYNIDNVLYGLGEATKVTDGNYSMDVAIQDQTTDIIDYYLCLQVQDLELSAPTVINERIVQVVDGSAVVNGNYLCIQENSRAFQAKILSGGGTNTLTLDTPLDYAFSTAASIAERTPDLDVIGSAVAPIVAQLKPIPGVKWDITRIVIVMTHSGAGDDSLFGNLTALPNGIVLRKSDGIHHTIFNAKTNGDLRIRTYDVAYSDKAGPGLYSTSCRRSFGGADKNGVVIRLDGDKDESLDCVIQDALNLLDSFRIVAQGHVVN